MSYFLFNGVNSDDLGLMVTKMPLRPTWKQDLQEFTLAGKSVSYIQKSKTYKNQSMTVETFLSDITPERLQLIYRTFQGDGKLWFSSSPAEYLEVIAEPPDIKAVAYLAGECSLKFLVKPFARAVNPTVVGISTQNSYTEVSNNGTLFSEPLIYFRPQSQNTIINVNNVDFVVNTPDGCSYESTIFIDCEEQIAYFQRPEGNIYTCTQYTEGDFPLLHTGSNYVQYSGAVQDLKINVRERFL